MPDVVRVASGNKWAYLPVGSEAHCRLIRMTEAGLASQGPGEIRLMSDFGPIINDLLPGEPEASCPMLVLPSLGDDMIYVSPGESLHFGKIPGADYNDFADLSRINNPSLDKGVPLSDRGIRGGDVVVAVWPKDKAVIPARAERRGQELFLELAENNAPKTRCFIMDETGDALLTVSLAQTGSGIKALPPSSLDSWLSSVGTRAIRRRSSKFSSRHDGDCFVITDNDNKRSYRGYYMTRNSGSELEHIDFLLSHDGLGAVLPKYKLFNT